MKGRFLMRTKIPMSYMCNHFGVEKTQIRVIFSELLGSDVLNALEGRFKNLGQLAEASDKDILSIPGIGEKTLKDIKEEMYVYFKKLCQKDELTKMPANISPARRLAYADLINEANLVSCTIKKIDKCLNKLPKDERKYIKMSFGLKSGHRKMLKEISNELEIPVCELDEYRVKVLKHLCDIAHK